MAIQIQARPDEEAERFQKAVKVFAIDSDGKSSQRLPKEIHRKLFPKFPNNTMRDLFFEAISVDVEDTTPGNTTDSSASRQSESALVDTPPKGTLPERKRNPYGGTPTAGKIDDLNLRPSRSNSTGASSQGPAHHRAASNSGPLPIPKTGASRRRSPSFRSRDGDFRRSDNDITRKDSPPYNDDHVRRYAETAEQKRVDWERRAAEAEARTFDGAPDRFARGDRDYEDDRGFYEDYYRQGARGAGTSGYDPSQKYPPYK
jgi:hypothetical protein